MKDVSMIALSLVFTACVMFSVYSSLCMLRDIFLQ